MVSALAGLEPVEIPLVGLGTLCCCPWWKLAMPKRVVGVVGRELVGVSAGCMTIRV